MESPPLAYHPMSCCCVFVPWLAMYPTRRWRQRANHYFIEKEQHDSTRTRWAIPTNRSRQRWRTYRCDSPHSGFGTPPIRATSESSGRSVIPVRVRAKRSKNEHRDHGGGGPPEAALTCSKTTSPPACSVRTRQLVRARQRCSCPPANVTPKQSTHQRAFEPRQELPSASTRTEVPPTRENARCGNGLKSDTFAPHRQPTQL